MSSSPQQLNTNDYRFSLVGFLPLIFFFAQAIHYWRINELGTMLWMCNIGNFVLALGLFLKQPVLIRVSTLWMVPGLLVWIVYVLLPWGVFLSSTLAHLGGLAVGLVVLRRVRMDRISWLYALGWYFVTQFLSLLFTPSALNVNLAHAIQPGWEHTFNSYWKFWLALAMIAIALLGFLNFVFYKLWPEE
jgi:hypothetical protein